MTAPADPAGDRSLLLAVLITLGLSTIPLVVSLGGSLVGWALVLVVVVLLAADVPPSTCPPPVNEPLTPTRPPT